MVEWIRRYRMLVVVYGVILVFGTREYLRSRDGTGASWQQGCQASAASCFSIPARAGAVDDSGFWARHAELTEAVAALNPDDPDTHFLLGMQAMQEGDEATFLRHLEAAVEAGAKHNEILLQYHAQYLLSRGADWRRVNEALELWRQNHPLSDKTLEMAISQGPRTPEERAVLGEALEEVRWIGGWRLHPAAPPERPSPRLEVTFRPAEPIDVREAVAAVTVLSLTEEQRASFRVTCTTLVDCRLTPRTGG